MVGTNFSQPMTISTYYLSAALGHPISTLCPKCLSLFFFLMITTESTLDNQQCCGGVSKCKFLLNFKVVIVPAT